MYSLDNLQPSVGSTHKQKRKGRGIGSGLGKTAGKGQKGQKSRTGGGVRVGFEGGQMPMSRRLPKFGFTNIFAKTVVIVNVSDLEERFENGAVIDAAALQKANLVKGNFDKIKLLGNGDVTKKFTVKVDAASASAKQKIEGAGGVVEVSSGK